MLNALGFAHVTSLININSCYLVLIGCLAHRYWWYHRTSNDTFLVLGWSLWLHRHNFVMRQTISQVRRQLKKVLITPHKLFLVVIKDKLVHLFSCHLFWGSFFDKLMTLFLPNRFRLCIRFLSHWLKMFHDALNVIVIDRIIFVCTWHICFI